MTQWIRWWGLGLFLLIVLALWLGTNPLIKWSIETTGTQAVGAKVELDSVSLRFNPVALELNRLQVTNPNAPMRNSMEAGRIEMALDGFALLRRQFIAENMAVEGLRFDTERETSGDIGGRWFSRERREARRAEADEKSFDIGRFLPGLDLPDPDEVVAREREQLQAKIDELDGEAGEIEQGWQDHIRELPDRDAVDAYRARLDEIRDMDRLRRVPAARDLRNDINDDLDKVRSLGERLETDRERVRELNARARALPADEARRLMAATGLDEGFEGVTRQLLGAQMSTWIQRGLGGYEMASEHLAGRKAEEDLRPPRGEGEYIRFPEDEPLPRFLIKRAALDGIFHIAGREIDFSGRIEDITNEPAVWGRPMTVHIDGRGEQGAVLAMNGTFDHRESPSRDEVTFTLTDLALTDATFSDSSRLPIVLERGVADIDGNLVVTEGRLDSSVNTRVAGARFDAGAGEGGDVIQRLARAIEGVSAFRLDLSLGGTLRSPEIHLSSDLDRIIGNAIGDEARRELAQAREELEERLRAELSPRLEELAERERQLEAYRERIDERRAALREIRP